ncbi:hypothetical protein QCA50_010474 [Cerrena zonata]|uniref:DUF676 domain-containing protein n=1 Tax=Cerrena zonata TaxID=2478898 RepID=A0AAW0G4H2_9APHY
MSEASDIHLLVLIHGMWGNPGHLAEMKRIYKEKLCQEDSQKGPGEESVHILVVETNRESATYDGIDWGGERVAEEIRLEIKSLEADGKKVTRFSVTGYSLGGLIARYVIGILHQERFFDKITPVNFTTVATPHIGLIRYTSIRSSLFAALGPKLLSRTGEQFYAVDKWSAHGRPLVEVMADPNRVFHQALALFPHLTFYGNAVHDVTVPYMTATVEPDDPFADHEYEIQIEFDEEYKPIIKSWAPSTKTVAKDSPRLFSKSWFQSKKPLVPPALDLRFPYNLLIYPALPLLLPLFLSFVVVKLSLDSRSSRSRIESLEKDESYSSRLVHIIGQLEKSMEDAVAELIDDAGNSDSQVASAETLAHSQTNTAAAEPPSSESPSPKPETVSLSLSKTDSSKPNKLLTDVQKRIIANLNSIPQLQKERVFIHPVINSHATIVARDVHRFKFHELGHGVLRHMADHFTYLAHPSKYAQNILLIANISSVRALIKACPSSVPITACLKRAHLPPPIVLHHRKS